MAATFYTEASRKYSSIGVDTESAITQALSIPVSLHCWQGDDVRGFEGASGLDGGGIQTTGNYPGAAKTPQELMDDIDKVLLLVPGQHKLNLHASYAVFEKDEMVDRDSLLPKHFAKWVEFAKERNLGIDFNPTFFSHPLAKTATLSSNNDEIRNFWIRHGIACLRISEYFAKETGIPCLMNIWIPDGLKDTPADRLSPRARFADSLDKILAAGYDRQLVYISLESKVFGIGLESYTVGSSEFCLNYAASRGIISLLDNGHYHPTEAVSDKISSMLLFADKIALHITRSVRWDSDHVVSFDDETREICKEIAKNNAFDRVFIATDFFDASINRIAAWVIGLRNVRKAMLYALLLPNEKFTELQNNGKSTELLMLQEEIKTFPFGEVWNELCRRCNIDGGVGWYSDVERYENDVLKYRKN